MSEKTACPLDCYDACSIVVDEKEKLRGDKGHPYTGGYLCPHLNHYHDHERITQPRYRGEVITMNEAVDILSERLGKIDPATVLHFRGHGNFGLMQEVTDHFFANFGATLTRGSLCDGAGEAGIIEGRGKNYVLPPEQIDAAEVVIVWGRNPHVTNSHILPFLRDKRIIVIDPVRTRMADQADLFLQIKPHGDLQLAMLISRFIMIEGMEDKEFLRAFAEEYEEFYELTQTMRIKATLEAIDLTLGDIGNILELIRGRRTVILTGVGVQKYRNGADVIRAIDAIGVILGLFGKRGSGVSFLGSSTEGIKTPFDVKARRIPKATADFSVHDLVFIQNANPLEQLPDTRRVIERMDAVDEVVYFGLYENATAQRADLVIPAKSFLEKEDVRLSYGHDGIARMPKVSESEIGISEYDLAARLCNDFDIDIQDEDVYLNHFSSYAQESEGMMRVKGRSLIPYDQGFATDDGQFLFLEELDMDVDMHNDMFLVTPKSPKSLNSQFTRDSYVYVHPQTGFLDGQLLRILSETGAVELIARHDARLRLDCLLIYSGTPGVNHLTPARLSFEGENAIYQENKVKVEIC